MPARYKPDTTLTPPPKRLPTNGSFKKGMKRLPNAGRKKGTPNKIPVLVKNAIDGAGAKLGYPVPIYRRITEVRQVKLPTGERTVKRIQVETDEIIGWKASGEGGLEGYLVWLGLHNSSAFSNLLGRLLPMQVNSKTTSELTVTQRFAKADIKSMSLEEVGAAFREAIGLTKPLAAPEPKTIDQEGNEVREDA